MGGGKAHFGQRGQKSPKFKEKNCQKFSTYRLQSTVHMGPRRAAPKDLKEQRQRNSRGGAVGELLV